MLGTKSVCYEEDAYMNKTCKTLVFTIARDKKRYSSFGYIFGYVFGVALQDPQLNKSSENHMKTSQFEIFV
jgi:hypothetical protein